MTKNGLLAALQTLASNFIRVPFPEDRPFDGFAFMGKSGIEVGVMRDDLQQYVGFKANAIPAIHTLATELRRSDPDYSGNIDIAKFQEITTKALIAVFLEVGASDLSVLETHLASVRLYIAKRWSVMRIDRYFIVPCILTPYESQSFSVGPVKFQNIDNFISTYKSRFDLMRFDLAITLYREEMDRRAACWVTEIRVSGRELKKAQTVADMATDIALASLQLLHPSLLRNAARITGRTNPVVRMDVSFDTQDIYGGTRNIEPGKWMSADVFTWFIGEHQQFLDSAGRRIEAYINGGSKLPRLEQSWCDAALWFHEGAADFLKTVSVAKMETAIEVLLWAESTKGSKNRIRKVFKAFRNLDPHSHIADGLPTVDELTSRIVTARSRVLHGTLSTLEAETEDEYQIAQQLVQQFLIAYSLQLDDYLQYSNAKDDTDAFLDWVHNKLFP